MEKKQTLQQPTLQFNTFSKNEKVTEYYAELKLNTKRPHRAHQMTFNYESIFSDPDSIQTNNLCKPLEKLKLIDALSIQLSEANIEDEMILQNLSFKMKSLSSLRTLKLSFPHADQVSLKGVEHLASALAQMKLLKKLVLNFHFASWVNDECLYFLLKTLKKYKTLESLNLGLFQCENITEKSLRRLASIFKHSLQSLKELSLGFVGMSLTEGNALDSLASGLTNLTHLQKLKINFSGTQISSAENFSSFLCSIKYLKSLRVLDLNFSFIPIDASTLKNLEISFKNLIRIHTLSLDFGNCSTFTIQEMEVLIQCLQSLASSLTNLTLNFNDSDSMDDQVLEKLSGGLKNLTNLSEINLQWNNCPNAGDAGVESVTGALGDLPNLHSVTLSFCGCSSPIKEVYENRLRMNKNIKKFNLIYDYY